MYGIENFLTFFQAIVSTEEELSNPDVAMSTHNEIVIFHLDGMDAESGLIQSPLHLLCFSSLNVNKITASQDGIPYTVMDFVLLPFPVLEAGSGCRTSGNNLYLCGCDCQNTRQRNNHSCKAENGVKEYADKCDDVLDLGLKHLSVVKSKKLYEEAIASALTASDITVGNSQNIKAQLLSIYLTRPQQNPLKESI
ncbi:hypothetical protein RRG08_017807 [Elysia crispata]|uniref:Uncharacterized protein n=1 Tax=Elysia crispata TaxID=231223 RepID=A0AAE1CX31_9GAST|nr:hypothetical protein RRG08_017807 [Elysia crispata]